MKRIVPSQTLLRGAAAAVTGIVILAAPAGAQSMDYGSLEALFKGPVTASATGSPQRDTDVPVNMTIITANEIRRSGARDITGVLRHVPGVDVVQWGADNSDVSIRGFSQPFASGTLVMIDGRQVYADYYGFIPWSTLPVELDAIRQIEVVKGPNAALFGFNAAGGAINIITYNPRYDDVNALTLRAGDPALGGVSGVAMLRFGAEGGLQVSAGYRRNDDFSTPLPPEVGGQTDKNNMRAQVNAKLIYMIGSNIETAIELTHSDAAVNEMSPNYSMQASHYQTNSVRGRITADTPVGMLQFTGYNNWIRWRGTPNPWLGEFAMADEVTVLRVSDLFSLGAEHTLRLEAGYRHNQANTAPLGGAKVSHDVWSGAAMWQWQVSRTLSLTTAIRLDHLALARSGDTPPDFPFTNADWNQTLDEVSYNFGAVWAATGDDTLRLIASRGVELPSLVKSGALQISAPGFSVTGNPGLRPTTVNNYELTWDHEFTAAAARLQIAAFHEQRHNIAAVGGDVLMTPTGIHSLPANVGNSRAWGAEIIASGAIGTGWHWSAAYRLETITDDFHPFAADGSDFVDYQNSTPNHLIKAGFGWAGGRWEIDAFVNWQSSKYGLVWPANTAGFDPSAMSTTRVPVPSFASVDGRIGFKLADWATLAVSGQNLLQASQRQNSGRPVARQIFFSLTLKG